VPGVDSSFCDSQKKPHEPGPAPEHDCPNANRVNMDEIMDEEEKESGWWNWNWR
jgi:hypothetical protein